MIIEFGIEAFQYLILVVPILILFSSFLLCESVYDLESKKWNEPWLFLIALVMFIFVYLAFSPSFSVHGNGTALGEVNGEESTSNLVILFPITLYLLYFIFIQAKLNYLYYNAYKDFKQKIEKKAGNKKQKITIKSKVTESNSSIRNVRNESKEEDQQQLVEQRTSWALFFGALIFIILSFIFKEIVIMEQARIIGLLILMAIPIIVIVLYFLYSTQNASQENNSSENIEDENELPMDNQDFKAPNPFIPMFLFISLIIFGFVIILYYSALDQLSNILVQSFIVMIWIILFFGFYNIGIPRGGADTKALMALVILFPIYPIIQNITQNTSFFGMLEDFPVTAYIFPFVFSILINASFVVLFFVIILLIYNITKGDTKFPNAVLGYKMQVEQVPKRFVWLMESIVEGEVDKNEDNKNKTNKKPKLEPFPKDITNLNKELEKFRKLGIKRVWVTPKIPFMIPLTIGLILALVVGNIVFLIIGLFV
jgi:preflagellin peptidase FlaK